MESNKHNIENFERFLREKTDEFRMYPSKRVWYSIYNNMHPGNRMPSLSMSILLVAILFLVGYLNTTDANKQTLSSKPGINVNGSLTAFNSPEENAQLSITALEEKKINPDFTAKDFNIVTDHLNVTTPKKLIVTSNQQPARNNAAALNSLKAITGKATIAINNNIAENILSGEENNVQVDMNVASLPSENTHTAIINSTLALQDNKVEIVAINNLVASNKKEELQANETSPEIITNTTVPSENEIVTTAGKRLDNSIEPTIKTDGLNKKEVSVTANNNNELLANNKAWIEDFALHNKPLGKKWAGKLSIQAYITPSVVYRKLINNAAEKQLAGTNNNFNNYNVDAAVNHKPSIGIETGLSLQYDISKRIRLKGGAQFNYTRYNALAFETNHPIAATLTMNYENVFLTYEVYRSSNYSNINGYYSAKLHNETYQFSLPVGVDYKLASFADNISWYAGATAQPTILLSAKSYVLSSDRRSYVHDPSLLNRFNLNAGFETYLSYKASGYTLQFGPQYRTQIFSTNTKLYTVEERLQNFGFKFGISKRL